MAGDGGQNSASSSPESTGKLMGSDEGLTNVPFWGSKVEGTQQWSRSDLILFHRSWGKPVKNSLIKLKS
jgi:hypothetical protein